MFSKSLRIITTIKHVRQHKFLILFSHFLHPKSGKVESKHNHNTWVFSQKPSSENQKPQFLSSQHFQNFCPSNFVLPKPVYTLAAWRGINGMPETSDGPRSEAFVGGTAIPPVDEVRLPPMRLRQRRHCLQGGRTYSASSSLRRKKRWNESSSLRCPPPTTIPNVTPARSQPISNRAAVAINHGFRSGFSHKGFENLFYGNWVVILYLACLLCHFVPSLLFWFCFAISGQGLNGVRRRRRRQGKKDSKICDGFFYFLAVFNSQISYFKI